MAIPVCNMRFPFKGHQRTSFWSQNPITTQKLSSKWTCEGLLRRGHRARIPRIRGMRSENDSIAISELGRERIEEEFEDGQTIIAEMPKRKLEDSRREIHGQNDWVGMLDPIDPILRSGLIRYGKTAQACYDAYDLDAYSKYCGSCKTHSTSSSNIYTAWLQCDSLPLCPSQCQSSILFRKSLWSDAWSPTRNGSVTSRSDDETSGYLNQRDITIAWRGTVTSPEWSANLQDYQPSVSLYQIPSPDPTVKAEAGILQTYTAKDMNCPFCRYSAREQALTEVKRLINRYADEELSITITGHSLGSALAI